MPASLPTKRRDDYGAAHATPGTSQVRGYVLEGGVGSVGFQKQRHRQNVPGRQKSGGSIPSLLARSPRRARAA